VEVYDQESDVFIGTIEEDDVVDWRAANFEDVDPDDELLENTPPEVVAMLGFDPKEL